MEQFTPWSALAGGALIGLSAALLLWFNGRIAGISGVLGELLVPGVADRGWRLWFLAGLAVGAVVVAWLLPGAIAAHPLRSPGTVIAAGLLVGVGTRMGNGCTSGHGVCGIPRGSSRSIVATLTFIGTGAVAVAAVNWLGGAL